MKKTRSQIVEHQISQLYIPDASLPYRGDAAGALIQVDKYYLLLQRGDGGAFARTWCPPGGRVDPGETPYEAMLREAWEEAHIDLSPYEYEQYSQQPIPNESGTFTLFYYFFPQMPQWVVQIDFESLRYAWVTRDEAFNLPLHPGLHAILSSL